MSGHSFRAGVCGVFCLLICFPPCSVRLHQQTVLNVLARAGSKTGRFLDVAIKNIKPESVQADEMFCYVGCKDRANKP